MRFGLSEEQEAFRDQLRRLLTERAPLARVREVAADGTGFDRRLWDGLTELGALGVLVPEEYGGLGMGAFDAGIVLEELGRFAAPAPYLGSGMVAPLVLAESTSNSVAAEWLPQIAGGEAKIGLALAEAIGARAGAGVSVQNGHLTGKALAAQDSGAADAFLVASGRNELWLVRTGVAGLTQTPMTSIDRTRALAELRFDGVEAEPVAGGEALVQRAVDLARIGLALSTLGAAEAMFEQSVEYAKQRVQFDRVIGSFQGVKHVLADMIAALEPARALVWYATYAQTNLPRAEAHRLACHAKAHCGEVGRVVACNATEVHGGMGFTDDLGLHYWFKRIGLDRQLLGSPEQVRAEAAKAIAA
jgi:alkylation response protein AidB-like acyl-CoA dehydrogenase